MILEGKPSRIGIYFFYDPEGIVDDYVLRFLDDMKKSLTRLVVVCNGRLSYAGRQAFEEMGASPLIVRANEGFDVWAYKSAIDTVGWDELSTYDELIMMNFTIMGPVGRFAPMFEDMASRDVDFWGITIHNGAPFDPWGKMPDGIIPLHLQSHFIAVRSRMHSSPEFRSYWDDLGPIESYEDSIAKHEALFTPRFASMGFSWDVYVDTWDLVEDTYYPLFNMPVDLIANRRSPIFKRKSFFSAPELYLDENSNRPARDLLDHLDRDSDYDIDLIWSHILRSANLYDIAMALNLFAVYGSQGEATKSDSAVGAIVGVRDRTGLNRRLSYLNALPPSARLMIVYPFDAPGMADIEEALKGTRWSTAILKPSRSSLDDWSVMSVYDGEFDELDLVCVAEAEPAVSSFPRTNTLATERNALDGVLASPTYVQHIIDAFHQSPRMGTLAPPRSLHHQNFGNYGHEWGDRFESVSATLERLGVHVPLHPSKDPITPADGVYWVRGAILTTGAHRALRHLELPSAEINHLTPLIAQAAGYFAGRAVPDFLATNFLTNATHVIRGANQLFGIGPGDSYSAFGSRLLARSIGWNDHQTQNSTPSRIYVDTGSGFNELNAIHGVPETIQGTTGVQFRFTVPAGTRSLRFDPTEGLGCICEAVSAMTGSGARVRLRPFNGVRRGGYDIFETSDPQYWVYSWPRGATEIIITMKSLTLVWPPFPSTQQVRPIRRISRSIRRAVGRIGLG